VATDKPISAAISVTSYPFHTLHRNGSQDLVRQGVDSLPALAQKFVDEAMRIPDGVAVNAAFRNKVKHQVASYESIAAFLGRLFLLKCVRLSSHHGNQNSPEFIAVCQRLKSSRFGGSNEAVHGALSNIFLVCDSLIPEGTRLRA
jgi:hypothetical protein